MVSHSRDSRRIRASRLAVVLLLTLLLLGSALVLAPPARAAASSYPPLTGTISGPTALKVNSASYYLLNATGGPAFALNGTQIGNLSFRAAVSSANTTGVAVSPTVGALVRGEFNLSLAVGNVTQAVTLQVEYSSVYQNLNESINVTYVVSVVHPYLLTGVIVAGNETVLTFDLQVTLDGRTLAPLVIPVLTPREQYNFTYTYVVDGLSSGYHTVVLTLPTQHGQVHFANGALSYSFTFYISGPAPDYTLYYLLGAVALVGVILIFIILVGARRRGGSRT